MRLDPTTLEQIRKREQKATEGPCECPDYAKRALADTPEGGGVDG